MKRKLLLVLAFIALPGFASALGLGKLQLNSALNQPFNARIELLSASADELDSLNIGLADTEAFRRARIDRPFILSKLKFEVKENEKGADYIQISSRDAIREPFLNFLLEASWSTGRLYREYTVLLDPPLYDPNSRRSSSSSDYSPAAVTESYVIDDDVADMTTSSSTGSGLSYSDEAYGPTGASDTLWSIATQLRPDNSVSVHQMMLALLRANPDAFVNGNINGLKRGQILNLPTRDEIDSLSFDDALADVKSQNASWQETRGMLAETVTDRAESMPSDDVSSAGDDSAAMIEDEESELRLVAASSDGAGMGQGSSNDDSAELALARERTEVVSQENAELKERMREAETIIEDLKRLISLKDDELAALQQQMATGASVIEQPEETDVVADIEDESIMDESSEAEEGEAYAEEDIADAEMLPEAIDETVDDEELVSDAEEMDEEVIEDEAVAETVGEEAQPAVDSAASEAPAGLLDQVIGFITGNLIMIAGALGALIIAIIGLLFISRRKQNAATEPASAAVTEFPDFDDSAEPEAEAAIAESETDPDIDLSAEATMSPDAESDAEVEAESVEPSAAEAVVPVAEAAVEEPEEDPLAEVNVFLAYEHFDQAEEFVREAIAGSPDNLDFHAKLLEVFYAANDLKRYEEAAQVLHDKVNGEGQHWEMAKAMWQEMSPNRALFEEGGDDAAVPAPAADTSGGIVDITAEDDAGSGGDDGGLDFDLGMDIEADSADEAKAEESVDDENTLDFDIGGMDVEADSADEAKAEESVDDENTLDFDIGGMDVEADSADEAEAEESVDDENTLDFDIGGMEAETAEDDNAIELDVAAEEAEVDLDLDEGNDGGIELDLSDGDADLAEISLELTDDADEDEDGHELSIDDLNDDADEGLEIDLSMDESDSDDLNIADLEVGMDGDDLEIDLTLDDDSETAVTDTEDDGLEMDFDLEIEDDSSDDQEIDMDGTMEMPKSELDDLGMDFDEDDDDDEEEDHTVFVPRAGAANEQTAEDEVATKLDLAKAYVELGDKDSARGILDEVMAEGNDEQKRTAEDLIGQLG